MILTTQDTPFDYSITKTLGVVFGNTVRTRHFVTDFFAGFKEIFGGEISGYTKLLTEAREEAFQRMIQHAQQLGADGIVTIRFSSSSMLEKTTEILATGTAVKLEPKQLLDYSYR